MSELKEIIEKEKQRNTIQQSRVMYFYKEGTFMRAYEFSAWLWCKYVKEFKPTRRKAKHLDDPIIHIGCPVSSLSNHLPDGAVATSDEESAEIEITLPSTIVPDDADIAAMMADFEQWKESCPLTETTKKKNGSETLENALTSQPSTITGIMQQILAFPVEQKSMLDCVAFLSDLKIQLAKLI